MTAVWYMSDRQNKKTCFRQGENYEIRHLLQLTQSRFPCQVRPGSKQLLFQPAIDIRQRENAERAVHERRPRGIGPAEQQSLRFLVQAFGGGNGAAAVRLWAEQLVVDRCRMRQVLQSLRVGG